MILKNRIELLERALSDEEWPEMEIHMFLEDCSDAGNGEQELFAVIKSGSPNRHGKTYYREETETEAALLERANR